MCELPKHLNSENPMVRVFLRCSNLMINPEMMDALKKGCPIMETFNISDFEPDKEYKSFLPPILPEGTFKFSFHVHDANNRTYAYSDVIFEIKPVGLSDFIKLG